MLNQINVAGNLTADPVVREVDTRNGRKSVCTFNVAANEWTSNGNTTSYFKVTIWGNRAASAPKVLFKGTPVFVTGKIRASSWIDRNTNEPRASLEITANEFTLLGRAPTSDGQRNTNYSNEGYNNNYNQNKPTYNQNQQSNKEVEIVDLDNEEIDKRVTKYDFKDQIASFRSNSQNNTAPAGTNKFHEDNKSYKNEDNVGINNMDEGDGDYE